MAEENLEFPLSRMDPFWFQLTPSIYHNWFNKTWTYIGFNEITVLFLVNEDVVGIFLTNQLRKFSFQI